MSASQSKLSDPKYGYDLVVATTQASINSTMKDFLHGLTAPELIVCYVYDSNNNLVEIPYDTLKTKAKGSDPFSVANGADTVTNQDLVNLTAANFAGGFKAQIGLPEMDPAKLPPIVTLGSGTDAPVIFNLLCAEFQIVGFQYGPRGSSTWINQAQPSGTPWYFTSQVKLNNITIDPKSPVPAAVQRRIEDLCRAVGEGAFSVQRLFLDLDTAMLLTTPTVVGIPEGWAVWNLIEGDFMGAYFAQMQKTGQPVLGYSCSPTQPDPSTLQLGAMSWVCCHLLDPSGKSITDPTQAQQDAATLNYLCTTGTTPPVAVPLTWNWVELGEVADCSGIQAVRRDIFVNFLAGVLNQEIASLCLDTTVSLTHKRETYYILYSAPRASDPTKFAAVSPGAAGSDGFASVLSLTFDRKSQDQSEASDHLSVIYGIFNYCLTGDVSVKDNLIRLTLHAVARMGFWHHECGIHYYDLPRANYFDKTLVVIYQLDVSADGELVVNSPPPQISDCSAPWNFHPKGALSLFGGEDAVKKGLNSVENSVAGYLDRAFQRYSNDIAIMINEYHSWVFPGGKTFAFNKILFSDFQDLITHVTYVEPTTDGKDR
jgi:hypothetical protein